MHIPLKVGLSTSKKLFLFVSMRVFQNYEKCFLFHVKNSFRSWDIYILPLLFRYIEKWLDNKTKFDFKTYDVIGWTKDNYNT